MIDGPAQPTTAATVGRGLAIKTVQRSVRAPSAPLGGCYDVPLLPFPMPSPYPLHIQHSSSGRSVDNNNISNDGAAAAAAMSMSMSSSHTAWPLGPANRAFLTSTISSRWQAATNTSTSPASYHIGDNRRYAASVPLATHHPHPPHSSDSSQRHNDGNEWRYSAHRNGSQTERHIGNGNSNTDNGLTYQHFAAMMAARDHHNQHQHTNNHTNNTTSSRDTGNVSSTHVGGRGPRVGDVGWMVDLAPTMIKNYGHGHIQGVNERQVVTDLHHSFTHLKGHPVNYRRQRPYTGAHYRESTSRLQHGSHGAAIAAGNGISPFVRAHRAALAAAPKPLPDNERRRQRAPHVVRSQ